MEPTDTNISEDAGGVIDTTPKPVYKDELAYLLIAAGLTAYATNNDIRGFYAAIGVYAIGNILMRIVSQVMEGKRLAK